jgi:Type I restriction modification DNA specificity domain
VDPEESGLERYVAGEHMDSDDLRIRRWGLVGEGYLGPAFHMRFKPGQVLYGSRRTYLRKVAAADFEGVTANTTFVLESKDPKILLPELLPFVMQTGSFHEHSIKQSKGSVNPYINFSDLTWYEFDLPPLAEQRQIAQLMRCCDAAREEMLRLEDQSRVLLRSLVADSCRVAGRNTKVSEVCPFVTSGSRGWAQYYSPSGRLFFRISNMRRGCIRPDWTDTKFVSAPNDGEAERTKVEIGDVLVSVTAELGIFQKHM